MIFKLSILKCGPTNFYRFYNFTLKDIPFFSYRGPNLKLKNLEKCKKFSC